MKVSTRMAEIVLGVGTSHSPLLAIDPSIWVERAKDDLKKTDLYMTDGRIVTYPELDAEVGSRYADGAVAERFIEQGKSARESLDKLKEAIEDAKLDVLIVIGDDQGELFSRAHTPAIAIYNGEELVTHPKNEVSPNLPGWYQEANRGYLMDTVHRHPGAPVLANAVIGRLIEEGVDVAVASEVLDPHEAGFGHAYGFVIDRLLGASQTAILPVMLNTYFPPNVPRPGRCLDIGAVIARAVEGHDGNERVGVLASGGLTHFVVDDDYDLEVIRALRERDDDVLRALEPDALRSGNSEILNWIMTVGAVPHLEVDQNDYIPVRRTPAGTGIGLAFMTWLPKGQES
jgi:hypothetical protein